MNPTERRKNEIEAKKAKLAELRRQRGERQPNAGLSRTALEAGQANFAANKAHDRKDIDELVNALIGETGRLGLKTVSDSHVSIQEASSIIGKNEKLIQDIEEPEVKSSSDVPSNVQGKESSKQALQHEPAIAIVPTITAPEVVTYSKGTQTIEEEESEQEHDLSIIESQEAIISRLRREIEDELTQAARDERKEDDPDEPPSKDLPANYLAEEERNILLHSTEFAGFIERSSKVLERALNEEYDLLYDYARATNDEDEGPGEGSLRQTHSFSTNQTKNRMITGIDWSGRFSELVLASYNKNPLGLNEPSGVVHVWNLHMSMPEFTFHAQSDITIARFSPFHANLIVGGSFSGQIVIWDTRASSDPVLQTPMSGRGHTHPIVGLNIVGTQTANNIISTSSDGLVCVWSIDMLAQPQETIELMCPPPSKIEELSPMSVSFPESDSSTFVVGSEDSNLYSISRQDRAGQKSGVDNKHVYKGHTAPITGVHHHPAKGTIDFGDLVLTSSLDWSIRLWKLKSASVITGKESTMAQSPLLVFEKEDIVYDVAWSPTRPGVFASVLGSGECQVHDICQDAEVAVARGKPASSSRSLNKVAWERDDGRRLAVGGLDGVLTVFDVGETLGGREAAGSDRWLRLSSRLKSV